MANSSPPPKRARLAGSEGFFSELPDIHGEIISVNVGGASADMKETFYVHKSVLCATSEFFRAAMKPEWTGPTPRPVDLSDERQDIFSIYVGWLYSGRVAFRTAESTEIENCNALAYAYVLGEKLLDFHFQNALIDEIIRYVREVRKFPPSCFVRILYKGTSSSSPGRRLVVDFWARKANDKWAGLGQLIQNTSADFVEDLVKALIKGRAVEKDGGIDPWLQSPHTYYVETKSKEEMAIKSPIGELTEDLSTDMSLRNSGVEGV